MLVLPEFGFQPSVNKHNVQLNVLVEWIEGSVVFIDSELAQSEVVDALREHGIYRDQDFATEIVINAWVELDRRSKSLLGGAPFTVSGRRIRRLHEWSANPAYAFCLLLSLQILYKSWTKAFGSDYTEQGELFERVTAESLILKGWTVHRAGWSPGNSSRIRAVVEEVCAHIGEPEIPGQLEKWISEHGNDEGLDLVCSKPFADGRGGRPLYLFQCASGANWTTKLHTPDPDTWRRVIEFTNVPKRGVSMPFALLEDEFRMRAGRTNGFVLDRFRLQTLQLEGNLDWLPHELSDAVLRWTPPRADALPNDQS